MTPNRNYKKKKKNSNNYLIFISILTVLAVITAILLIITVYKKDDPETESGANSHTSSEVASEFSTTSSAESIDSIESIVSQTTSVISGNPTTDYENAIGKEYAIDMTAWEQYVCPENDDAFLILVNKTHTLASDYVPADMIDVVATRKDGRATQKMVSTAEKALEAFMLEAAQNNVTNVTVTSAYRSYTYQETLFNGYCNDHQSEFATREECEAYVNTFSARPGQSEHQSGLVCDMHNLGSAEISFANTAEAKWLAENAHRFGFILRFQEDKVAITGYQFEPWHFRFVGRTAATEMYESGQCLEEYLETSGAH